MKNLNPKSFDATRLVLKGYRWLGIHKPKSHRLSYAVYSVIISVISCVLMPASLITTLMTNKIDLRNFLINLQTCINILGIIAKVILGAFQLPKLCQSEEIISKLDAKCLGEDEKNKILNTIKFGNRTMMFFLFLYVGVVQGIFLTSIVARLPPYSLYIPYIDWRRSNFDLAIQICIEYLTISIACLQQATSDAYSVIFLDIIRTHVLVLRCKIEKLGVDEEKSRKESTIDLLNCITHHKNILELYGVASIAISRTVFVHFLTAASEISITMISLTAFPTPLSTFVAFAIYIFAVAMGIFPCCYVAHCLMDESDLLPNTIFHCNWMSQDMNFKKMLLVFLQRSQKTIELSAGKMIPITLHSFVAIARFSFSLYTLFSQMELSLE